MKTKQVTKKYALAKFLGITDQRIADNDYHFSTPQYDNILFVDGHDEFLVLTNSEADQKCADNTIRINGSGHFYMGYFIYKVH